MQCGAPVESLPALIEELRGSTVERSVRVGFIGLGNIGAPMARRLLRPEFELTVHDNHAEALQPFEGTGARLTTSCAELVRSSQVIAVCVRDDVELLAVAYGDGSLSDSIEPGTTVLVHSTVRPQTVRDLGESLALRGGRAARCSRHGRRASRRQPASSARWWAATPRISRACGRCSRPAADESSMRARSAPA